MNLYVNTFMIDIYIFISISDYIIYTYIHIHMIQHFNSLKV